MRVLFWNMQKKDTPQEFSAFCQAQKVAPTFGMAAVSGAELGSKTLEFAPSQVAPSLATAANIGSESAHAQRWEFDIGSAGSSILVAQTIILILLHQRQHVAVTIIGGTHNPLASSADCIRAVFIPILARMGAKLTLELERLAGGGEFVCTHATAHLHTNADVIRAFDAAEITFTPMQRGAVHVKVKMADAA